MATNDSAEQVGEALVPVVAELVVPPVASRDRVVRRPAEVRIGPSLALEAAGGSEPALSQPDAMASLASEMVRSRSSPSGRFAYASSVVGFVAVLLALGLFVAWGWLLTCWSIRGISGGWFCIYRMWRGEQVSCSNFTWATLNGDRKLFFFVSPFMGLVAAGLLMAAAIQWATT
jgi:hypothetical protein